MAKQVKTNSRFKPLASNTKVSNTGSFKPLKTNTNISTSIGNVVKGGGYQAPKKTTTPTVKTTSAPRTRGGVSKGNAPGVANKYANKTPLEKKPVVESKPRTRAGVSKGGAPGTAGKYANKTPINKVSKFGKVAGKIGKVAGKIGKTAGTLGVAYQIASLGMDAVQEYTGKPGSALNTKAKKDAAKDYAKKHKSDSLYDQVWNAVTGKYDKPKKGTGKSDAKKDTTNTGKPQVGGNRSAKTLIETPSLKDELKKRGVDTKPVKDKAKTNDKSKVGGKDKWGRSPSSKWYGFNPESKKYEAPTMVKGDNKKSDTKVETKKPATTPKVTAPKTTTPKASTPAVKKAEPVGTLAPKSTTEIANKSLEEAKTITPAATSTSSQSSASTTTSSPKVTGVQPRASFINRVRGVVNESRERRVGRAASRGNEDRSERLKEKISETEKKMMMKKGGSVKSKTKKK